MPERDPVEALSDGSEELYDVATWEQRTLLDRVSVLLYRAIARTAKAVVVLVGFSLLVAVGGFSALTDPQIATLTLLSAIPAVGLAVYVQFGEVGSDEPVTLLVVTFLLGVLTANFAAVVNTLFQPAFAPLGGLGMVAFFFLVVGPIEETVKLLAVRLYAYGRDSFDCVVDGAVYGAMAGLGFATVENSLFIARQVGDLGMNVGLAGLIGAGGGITAVRALAGPGHVIYSAIAGYYLGLAKFNREHRGPILVKGLLLATFVHATYNSTVGVGSALVGGLPLVPDALGFLGYVVIYDAVWGLFLFAKIRRYNATLGRLRAARDEDAGTDTDMSDPTASTPTGDPDAESE